MNHDDHYHHHQQQEGTPHQGAPQNHHGAPQSHLGAPHTQGNIHSKDPKCGILNQYQRCLRRLCGPGGFLVIYCLQQVVGGGATTYLAASTTHLHRHLRLSHRHLAAVLLLRDLGPVLTGVVLSQLGGRGHRPRWVAAGQLLAALATFATLATVFTHPPPPSPAEWMDSSSSNMVGGKQTVLL
ncbi:solute carrier organic anion transporter family member 74D-like [Homarus americanus]|uniref:solute carrier organic anion transporter family member 74D-like n=1 Tax=Homarus americanus TaxID=6706 RepID=UPI001C441916|nr:solute carrier organic anion transporter family member 74D-like [Homarus americanus]